MLELQDGHHHTRWSSGVYGGNKPEVGLLKSGNIVLRGVMVGRQAPYNSYNLCYTLFILTITVVLTQFAKDNKR